MSGNMPKWLRLLLAEVLDVLSFYVRNDVQISCYLINKRRRYLSLHISTTKEILDCIYLLSWFVMRCRSEYLDIYTTK